MSRAPETGHLVAFGDFVFDRRSLELRQGSHVVPLQEQPAHVLAFLIERAGRVVTREDLRQAVWCTDARVDFDRGLSYCINQIRAALGDAADAPRYLETLSGRGYRFTPDIRALPVEEPASHAHPAVLVAAVPVLALLVIVAWWAMMPARVGPNALGIGVFAAAAGSVEWAEGLRTDLLARLARDAQTPVVDLARHAGLVVPWRIEARVDGAGGTPDGPRRVTVMLRDGRTGIVRWSDVFDPQPGDAVAGRQRLSEAIARAVRMALEDPAAQPAEHRSERQPRPASTGG